MNPASLQSLYFLVVGHNFWKADGVKDQYGYVKMSNFGHLLRLTIHLDEALLERRKTVIANANLRLSNEKVGERFVYFSKNSKIVHMTA
ncbi:hypothetical protein NPIL_82651 [Nephila pilipes]|uniref:Uncharacterized protein n=1 Tax=Nephila pilipes TaxID=299642 RepID=A0A8X6PDS0_NEPPI|nr:hypothetical protein NPIL_82651 [Nephila pilipes]